MIDPLVFEQLAADPDGPAWGGGVVVDEAKALQAAEAADVRVALAELDDIDEPEREAPDPKPVGRNALSRAQQDERRAIWRKLLVDYCKKPRPKASLKIYAMANLPTGVVDEVIAELIESGLIEKFDGFKGPLYRAAGVKAVRAGAEPTPEELFGTGAGDLLGAPVPQAKPALAQVRAVDRKPLMRSVAMAKGEYVSKEEAAKLLGCGESNLTVLARAGKIKSRRIAGRGRPCEYLRSSLVAHQQNFLDDSKPDEAPPVASRAVVPRKPRAIAAKRVQAGAAPFEARVRWLVDGCKIGVVSRDELVDQLLELVG